MDALESETQLRVFWVTNFAAPYRVPVWRILQQKVRLRIGLLESDERIGNEGHERGLDWRSAAAEALPVSELKVVSVARWRNFTYTLLPWIGGGLRAADVVVLGNWEAPAFWQLLIAARVLRKRVVLFSESTLASRRRATGPVGVARRVFFRAADAVVVPGVAAREAVLDLRVEPSRIHMGFNAVDVNAFSDAERPPGPPDGHRFLFVGQLISRKRPLEVVEAFKRSARAEDRLTIVGSGPLAAAVADLIANDARISSLPYVPNADLPDLFARNDTLLLPSTEEVWGLVVNEALAAGLHAVIGERCGVRPSVEAMRGVYVVNGDDAELLSAMIRSREEWRGAIATPEILAYTPERFAEVFLRAFQAA